jgi:hypothetical protein
MWTINQSDITLRDYERYIFYGKKKEQKSSSINGMQ